MWNSEGIKACFATAAAKGHLPPRVELRFRILPFGRATELSVTQTGPENEALVPCLQEAVRGLVFPASLGTEGTLVTYPFILQ